MCVIDLDRSSVWNVRRPKARKPHRCACCLRTIPIGTVHVRLFSVYDGSGDVERACADCWADIEAFGDASEHMQTNPSCFEEVLRECVQDGAGPDGEGPWAPMLVRIHDRQAEAQHAAEKKKRPL